MSTEVKKAVTILGVPLGYGASMAGVDIGPAALRVARLNQRIACKLLAGEVEGILGAGEFPIIVGGDHSIAIGSFAGAAAYFRRREQSLGLIWFDAHAD